MNSHTAQTGLDTVVLSQPLQACVFLILVPIPTFLSYTGPCASLALNPDPLYHVNHSGVLRLPVQSVYLAANSASGNAIRCRDMLNSYVLLGLIFFIIILCV